MEILEKETNLLNDWFTHNNLISNNDKSKLLAIHEEKLTAAIGNDLIHSSTHVKLLAITIDSKLNFQQHVSKLCQRASRKIHALGRISQYIETNKLKIIMRAFIETEFNYCPLTWMFHSRTLNNKINKLHERALRITYKDEKSTFSELLEKDKSVTIHERNIQKLATLMYKVKNKISPPIINEIYNGCDSAYNLRTEKLWGIQNVRTTIYGTEKQFLFGAQKYGEMFPKKLKIQKHSPNLKEI